MRVGKKGRAVNAMGIVTWARRAARRIYFVARLDRVAAGLGVESAAEHRTQAYWDNALAGSFSSYLGGSLIMAVRDELVACLIREGVARRDVVLDVGCASGQLAASLARLPIREYVGIDISAVAIDKARLRIAELERAGLRATFSVSDLCQYSIESTPLPDVVVFNEVLYYLTPAQASDQVARILSACPHACIIVSMKDDVKSRRVYEELGRHIRWANALLYQEKGGDLEYVVRPSRERPAYLIALGGGARR